MKTLNEQVAEALGWVHPSGLRDCCISLGNSPCCPDGYEGFEEHAKVHCIPRYDTDWAATGPLIERYSIDLNHFGDGDPKDCSDPRSWFARHERKEWGKWDEVEAATPLLAACELIVMLKKLGELD